MSIVKYIGDAKEVNKSIEERFQDEIEMLDVWFKGKNARILIGVERFNRKIDTIFLDVATHESLGVYCIDEDLFDMMREHYGNMDHIGIHEYARLLDKHYKDGLMLL